MARITGTTAGILHFYITCDCGTNWILVHKKDLTEEEYETGRIEINIFCEDCKKDITLFHKIKELETEKRINDNADILENFKHACIKLQREIVNHNKTKRIKIEGRCGDTWLYRTRRYFAKEIYNLKVELH